jgi:hypothetical protein
MDPRFFRKYLDIISERTVIGPDGKPLPGIGASGNNPNTPVIRSPEEEEEHRQAQKDIEDTLKARDAETERRNAEMRKQGQTRALQIPK